MSLLQRLVLFGALATVSVNGSAHSADDPPPSPTAILQSAVQDAPTKGSDSALIGLRRLKDPALRPLFSALAASEHPAKRRQGVLGLAELETPPRMNPLLLSRLTDPIEQAALLGEGLSLDLIGVDQIEQILAWPNLEPYVELSLRARLAREGKPLDVARVEALAGKSGMSSDLLAAALLAQSGKPKRLEELAGQLLALPDPQRGALVSTFLEAVRREKLGAASPLLARLEAAYASYPTPNADILRTWIRVAPAEGTEVWKKKWAGANGLADRLRLALVALDASDLLAPELFTPIESATEDPSLAAMGRLGATLSRGEPAREALRALIRLRYLPVELWIIDRATKWDEETATDAHRAIITAWASRASLPDPVSDAVLPAAEGLVVKDRAFLATALKDACEKKDERICHGILMAHLAKGSAPVWDVAAPPAWPDKQCEALDVLVRARSSEPSAFPKGDIPALEAIASGIAPRLPAAMRAQAAWMLLRMQGQTDSTLARLLAGKG